MCWMYWRKIKKKYIEHSNGFYKIWIKIESEICILFYDDRAALGAVFKMMSPGWGEKTVYNKYLMFFKLVLRGKYFAVFFNSL